MKKAIYICFEGTEGVGKTTQAERLYRFLLSKGFKVLHTKEPGSPHSPITMALRNIMLSNDYDKDMTIPARELISQAIRSIHLEKIIAPALTEYDFIIQDRGILSGYAYGLACGNEISLLRKLSSSNIDSLINKFPHLGISQWPYELYDHVILLNGDVDQGLRAAITSKQEFTNGDAIESRGSDFINLVSNIMRVQSSDFNTVKIDVDSKTIDEIHEEILTSLKLKDT